MTDPADPLAGLDETGEAIDARRRIVAVAEAELGEQDPDKYWAVVCPALMGHAHSVSWCGGFALWCLRQALPELNMAWVVGKGFVRNLPGVTLPEPGDVAVFGPPLWHHAIVTDCRGGHVYTVDGNTMHGLTPDGAPLEGVTRKARPMGPEIVFYSIGRLISA